MRVILVTLLGLLSVIVVGAGMSVPSALSRVTLGTGRDVDAFSRFIISSPRTLFDSKEVDSASSELFWSGVTSGGATITYVANTSSHTLECGTGNGDRALRQTMEYMPYQPGKSLLILATGVIGSGRAGASQRMGYFDDEGGVFLEVKDGSLGIVLRSSTSGSSVDARIEQAAFNGDKLDGSGPSGVVLDLDKTIILFIALEWLGVGQVSVGIKHNRDYLTMHTFKNSNAFPYVYMRTPNLPVRYEVVNTAETAGATSLHQICSTAISEGGFEPIGVRASADTGVSAIGTLAAGSGYPVLSIRLDDVNKRKHIELDSFKISSSGSGDYLVRVVIGGTLTGPLWTAVPGNSISEVDTSSSAITGGTTLDAFYVTGEAGQSSEHISGALSGDNPIGCTYAGEQAAVSVVIYPITNSDVTGVSLQWREVR